MGDLKNKNKERELGKKDVNKLNSEDLEAVSGGLIYHARNHPTDPWEVIDKNTGEVKLRCKTRGEAESRAQREYNESSDKISWKQLKKIRQGENGINLNR